MSLLPSGGSELLEGLAQAGEGDLVVLFSFSKVSWEGRTILDYQKQAGYRTLAFTSRSYLPEDQRADINLFAYRGEPKEYHSMAAPAALLDAPGGGGVGGAGGPGRAAALPPPPDEKGLPHLGKVCPVEMKTEKRKAPNRELSFSHTQ